VSRLSGTALALLLSTPLHGQGPPSVAVRSLDVERLATVAVRNFPRIGYVVIESPADWRRFRDRYVRPGGLHPELVRLDFSSGPVLGVLNTISGCGPGPLVHELERGGDTLHVIFRWVPNQWGPCQMIQHGGELVQLRSNPKKILFFDATASDSVEQVIIRRVELR